MTGNNQRILYTIGVSFALSATLNWASAKPQAQAKKADTAQGAALFKKNCQNCHSNGTTGGCLGPILAGEGARRSRSFIESRISNDPKQIQNFAAAYGHAELMPHLRVSPTEAKALTSYLISLPSPESGLDVKSHGASTAHAPLGKAESPEALARGKKLVYEKGCLMCHSFGGIGGQFAPPFDGIAKRRTEEFIADRITSAELLKGTSGSAEYEERGIVMPPSQLSSDNIKDIAAYLSSLK